MPGIIPRRIFDLKKPLLLPDKKKHYELLEKFCNYFWGKIHDGLLKTRWGIPKGLFLKFYRDRRQRYWWISFSSTNFCWMAGGFSEGIRGRTPGDTSGGILKKKNSYNIWMDLYAKISKIGSSEIKFREPLEKLTKMNFWKISGRTKELSASTQRKFP